MTKKSIKILSLGLSQSNFLNQLYSEIKKLKSDWTFDVDRFYDLSGGQQKLEKLVFLNSFQFSKSKVSKGEKLRVFFMLIFTSFFWKSLRFEMGQSFRLRTMLDHINRLSTHRAIVKREIEPLKHDIYHFHFCLPHNLKYLNHLSRDAKSICSFWGSDVFRYTDKETTFYVSEALKRTSLITIQTREMAEVMLKRYGNHLRPKVRNALFAQALGIYDEIDKHKGNFDSYKAFKYDLQIPLVNKVISIGYNGSRSFHHLDILKAFKKLPNDLKDGMSCVLLLSYLRDEPYIMEINEFINANPDLHIVTIDQFLSQAEIAKLRLVTDIQIQMPISDALSGSVTEVMYAGNLLLAGDWLPYKIFKEKDLEFIEVKNYVHLTELLAHILPNFEDYKLKMQANPKAISAHFFPEQTTPKWVALYEESLVSSK